VTPPAPTGRVAQLFADVAARHPRNLRGIEEARAIDPERFDATAETYLGWLEAARGEGWLTSSVDAFAQFSGDVIYEQARYEAAGRYIHTSFAEAHADVYSQREVMDDYLWGVYITNFLWSHHMDIMRFFQDRFLAPLPDGAHLVEIAPGHGGWGAWALHARPDATLEGYDISPSSIAIASAITGAAGVGSRATYTLRNALDLTSMPEACADALICSFLVEHLEQPEQLFAVIARLLKPGGTAFITGALTAAQIDHIYEFRRESELIVLCEQHGLRVRESLSVAPKRILPKAKFLPRSMAMAVTRMSHADW
jgi:2-polyprenyl-3-methyl-5-hydroxy-6-metoxy-1,4-benzoquinol methylase